MSEESPAFVLTSSQLSRWRDQFYESPINRLAQNVCTTSDPYNACVQHVAQEIAGFHEILRVPTVGKATTMGASWICAGLDLLRLPFVAKHRMPDFEFSTAYLLYWHKMERCNYFLHSVVELLDRCEPIDGRTFSYLMKHAIPDAGNWQMFVNLVRKHGLMPKKCYLVSVSATRTLQLNKILRSKLHEYSSQLHAQYTFDGDTSQLPAKIETMREELYKVISICLGTPPVEFNWTYYDLNKRYQNLENLTALDFYELLVKPCCDLESHVCLGHDPRVEHTYQHNYHVAYSSNMVGGLRQSYNNQPMDVLLQSVVDSLRAGSAVWIACDLQPRFYTQSHLLSLTSHNFELLFGTPLGLGLSRAERLLYHDSRPNTALLLTAVTLDEQLKPLIFRTVGTALSSDSKENSATALMDDRVEGTLETDEVGRGASGSKAISLSANWFREYGFEIVVDSRFVPSSVLNVLQAQNSTELPIWDAMGRLLA
ncbi:bleomycin hydrolase [Scaptodrosophila lebanonensis]|uniref:Bleomycin hydrolase n=1 Tax=Drosophila lebanonensis TaxID=7225 RepID=A0A6J2UIS3_DROLE|nr:bleomycin hydrolase [Scaptodrosophila lebanonensis]